MENRFPLLTSPITLGRTTFRNRMFGAPMGATDITAECNPGPRSVGFYELRAKGGAASVAVSELVVHPETDGSHMLHLNLTTPGNLASHTYVADAISRHGAVATLEFSHSGQFAGTYLIDKDKKRGLCQYGPSDTVRKDGIPVKALTHEQLADIVRAYGDAAVLAKRAGYGMIMVHGGHSWLINQFLSPWFNKRTDEYGGSFENRVRLAREVLSAVREAVGPGFPIEFRMSGSELFEGGYGIGEGCEIAAAVEDLVDLIHVSAGSYQFGFFNTHLPMFAPRGANVELAAEIKKHVSKPVATIGGLADPVMMEEILESGKADVVSMARALLADPFLPDKVCAGREDEIETCLRCFTCMAERPVTQTRRCAINPLVGREIEGLSVTPAARTKRVLVVGAGVAGLKAAHTAALRGHRTVLCEAADHVGGILHGEQGISFKRDMYELGLSLERECVAAGVEIRLNTRVDAAYVEREAPDALIVAVGSLPVRPPITGIDGPNVIVANDYWEAPEAVADTAVVLGGGLAGCEMAVELARLGKEVHLVEMGPKLAPDCNIRQRPILMRKLEEGVTVHLNARACEVTSQGLVCTAMGADAAAGAGERFLVPGETVVCAAGQRANRAVADELRGTAPWVRVVGDCVRPANITRAVYEAYHAALDI